MVTEVVFFFFSVDSLRSPRTMGFTPTDVSNTCLPYRSCLPSLELTYSLPRHFWVDGPSSHQVGYVSSVEYQYQGGFQFKMKQTTPESSHDFIKTGTFSRILCLHLHFDRLFILVGMYHLSMIYMLDWYTLVKETTWGMHICTYISIYIHVCIYIYLHLVTPWDPMSSWYFVALCSCVTLLGWKNVKDTIAGLAEKYGVEIKTETAVEEAFSTKKWSHRGRMSVSLVVVSCFLFLWL